jgi:hypothetical protein
MLDVAWAEFCQLSRKGASCSRFVENGAQFYHFKQPGEMQKKSNASRTIGAACISLIGIEQKGESVNLAMFIVRKDTNNCEDLIGLAEGLSQESANAPIDHSNHDARLDGTRWLCGVSIQHR